MHALIDIGSVTSFDCQAERCIVDGGRAINLAAITTRTDRPADALQIDHIVPRIAGGNDRLDNLRITHYVCNVSRAFYQHGNGSRREWYDRHEKDDMGRWWPKAPTQRARRCTVCHRLFENLPAHLRGPCGRTG